MLDESAYNFQQADPTLGGDPTTLNLASLANAACVGLCTWTRTLQNVDATPKGYTVTVAAPINMALAVEPALFMLAPHGRQVVTITADT